MLVTPRSSTPALEVETTPTRIGEHLADDRFVLLNRLGEGGNAVVWRARDRMMRAMVAVKILRSADADRQRRFVQEAEVLANIRHANVVRALSRGVTSQGQPYVVLELVTGQSLRERLDAGGPLPWREVLGLGIQVAAALEALHARGVIHRDVKPDNIMLTTDDAGNHVVKLLDFGIARLTAQYDEPADALFTPPPPRRRTDVGVAIGTPGYMPLEAGLAPPDERFDVYSLGVTLYELCTGKLPELALASPQAEALPGCDAPADLAVVLAAALALEASDRTQTAGELGRALAAVRAAHPEHKPSRLFDGRYELIAVLGTGARGDVLLANHRGSKHDVALKFLRSSDHHDVQRFQREAHLLAFFEHPSIPRFYDYAPGGDPPYIAMARAAGVPAAKFCQLGDGGRLSPVEVAQVGWQVARVLEYIHHRGVLHRDLNANNVLIDLPRASPMTSERVHLDRTPGVMLVDFGNAELTAENFSSATHRFLTPPESRIVIPDGGIHTLGWAAPEARAGLGFTAKSDVYSLGLLLYRLLTGKLPTSKKQAEPVSPRVLVPTCPQDIALAILSALNPEPDQRPSAAQLAAHLEDALTDDEVADEAAADDDAPPPPVSPPSLSVVVPLRPPRSTAPTEPRGWTRFFAATEDLVHPRLSAASRPASANDTEGPSAKILPLHPRDILERATTLEPDFAPAVPTTSPPSRVRIPPVWTAAALLLVVGAVLFGSLRHNDAPRPTEPATPRATQEARFVPQGADDPQHPAGLPESAEQALTRATEALTACAREARNPINVEGKTSPAQSSFTSIDIESENITGITCARKVLEQLRFQPPPAAKTLIKEYQP